MGLPQKSKNINYFLSHLNGKANVTYMSILKTKPNHTLVVDRLVLGEGQEQPGQVQPESHQLHHFAALPHTPRLPIPSWSRPSSKPKWWPMSSLRYHVLRYHVTLLSLTCFALNSLHNHFLSPSFNKCTPLPMTKVTKSPTVQSSGGSAANTVQILVSWRYSRITQYVADGPQEYDPEKIWLAKKAKVSKIYASYGETDV